MKPGKYILFLLSFFTSLSINAQEGDCEIFLKYFENGEYDKTISALYNCKKNNKLSGNDLIIADFYLNISYLYIGDTINFNSERLEYCLKRKSLKNTEYAYAGYMALAVNFITKSNYKKGIDYALKSVTIAKSLYGRAHINYLKTLFFLGKYYMRAEEYENAIKIYEDVVKTFRSLPEDNYELEIEVLKELSETYSILGNNQRSINYASEVVGIAKLYYGDAINYVEALTYLAERYLSFESYEKAIETSEEALRVLKRIPEDNYDNTINVLLYISMSNLHLGNFERAIEYASETLDIIELYNGKNDIRYVQASVYLAKCYMAAADYAKVIELNEQTLQILNEKGIKDNEEMKIGLIVSLSDCYSYLGSYQKSIDYQEKVLPKIKQLYGVINQDYATVTSKLAKNYSVLGRYTLSIETEEEALNIREELFGIEHEDYAASLSNLAEYYGELGEYKKSIEINKNALETLKATVGEKHHYYATAMSNMAVYYLGIGSYKEGMVIAKEAVDVVKKVLGENHLQYPKSLGTLGVYYLNIDNFEKALDYTNKALFIIEKTVGKEHSMHDTYLGNLGLINFYLGNYEKAIELEERVLEAREKKLGKYHPGCSLSLMNLAGYYSSFGNYDKAIELGEKSLEILKEATIENHPKYASNALNTLSSVYINLGDYQKAIDLNKEAGLIIKQALGEGHSEYALILNNLSNIYSALGNYQEAINNAEDALDIMYDNYGIEHTFFNTVLHNLANHYANIGSFNDAIELEEMVLENIKEKFGINNRFYATGLNNLSWHYSKLNNHQKAVELAEESIEIRKSIFGENHPDYAVSLNNLAILVSENDIPKAIELLQKSLRITEDILGVYHPNYELGLSNMAKYYLETNNLSLTLQYTTKFFNSRKHRLKSQFLWLTEKERAFYLQKMNKDEESIDLYSFSYASQCHHDFVEMSFDAALLSKGLLLQSSIELNNLLVESGNEEVVEKAEELRTIHHTLNRLYEKPISERYLNIDSLETAAQNLEKQLLAQSKEYGDYTQFMSVTWQDVQKGLSEVDVAIEFVEFPVFKSDSTMYAALVLRKDWERPQMISLFEKREIEQYMTQAPDKQYSGFVSKQLYKLMWKPLEEVIQKGDVIHFSAAGVYHQLALEYLPSEDGTPLCDIYSFRRLSSTRQLAIKEKNTTFESATLYGGIQYNVNPTDMLVESKKYQDKETLYAYRGMAVDSLRGGNWVPLDNTVKEVEFISNELATNKIETALFTGTNANEESIKALSGKKTNILHLATHGFFLPIEETRKVDYYQMIGRDDNPTPDMSMRRSGLIMAGGNRAWIGDTIPEGIDDGILTAQEISALDFREMDLVVLSACETALGDIDTSEGVFGLQRAFKKAGAKTLIMSLWKVNDEVTKSLMNKFYKSLLSGKTKHDAFLEAQQFIRFRHPEPQNWAAFIMLD